MNEVRHAPVAAQKPSITATVCGLASKRISGKSRRLSMNLAGHSIVIGCMSHTHIQFTKGTAHEKRLGRGVRKIHNSSSIASRRDEIVSARAAIATSASVSACGHGARQCNFARTVRSASLRVRVRSSQASRAADKSSSGGIGKRGCGTIRFISRRLSVLRLFKYVRSLQLEVHEAGFWDAVFGTPLRHRPSGYAKNSGNLRRTAKRINNLVCIHARNLSALRHNLQAI